MIYHRDTESTELQRIFFITTEKEKPSEVSDFFRNSVLSVSRW